MTVYHPFFCPFNEKALVSVFAFQVTNSSLMTHGVSGVISNIPLSSINLGPKKSTGLGSEYQSKFTLVSQTFRYLQHEATSTILASVHHCNFTLNISKTPSTRAKHVSLKDNFLTELCNQNFEPTLTSGRLKTWIFWLLFNNKHQFL